MGRVETIADAASLWALRDEWNALADRAAPNAVFLSWDWLHTWWDTFGRPRLLVGLVRDDDGVLRGLAPLYLAEEVRRGLLRCRTARLLGDREIATDFLDVLVDPEVAAWVRPALAQWLGRDQGWEQLVLAHTDEAGCEARALYPAPAGALVQERFPCPVVRLPPTWRAYLDGLSGSRRQFLGRRRRQLEREAGARVAVLRGAEAARRGVDALFDLHRARWRAAGRAGEDNLARPEVERFHRAAAPLLGERDRLRCVLIEDRGGEPLAALYGFRDRRRFYFFQIGHAPAVARLSPGAVVIAAAIEAAIGEGCEAFEMLRGGEGYKEQWQNEVRWIRTLRLARPGRGAALLGAERMFRLAQRSLGALRRAVGRGGDAAAVEAGAG